MHRKAFLFCTLLTLMVFWGCATGEVMTNVSPGMSQTDVVGVLGRPDSFKAEGDYKVMKYTNRLISAWSWDRADFFVILKDDKVTQYGSGEVREKNVGGVNTLFIHKF